MDEIEQITKQKNEVLKRIQERQRLMELIQNKNLKQTTNPMGLFLKTKCANKIQNAFRRYREIKRVQREIEIQKENAKYKFNSTLQNLNLDLIMSVIRIQRKFRNFLLNANHEKTKNKYLRQYREEAYKPISYERSVELRKQLLEKLKTMKIPEEKDYEMLINKYFNMYKEFCVNFPQREFIREENILLFYKNFELLKHLENLKNENERWTLFTTFMLDKNRQVHVRKLLDEMEKAYNSNAWWYEDGYYDDFEENNLLDEIDNRYGYKKRSEIFDFK